MRWSRLRGRMLQNIVLQVVSGCRPDWRSCVSICVKIPSSNEYAIHVGGFGPVMFSSIVRCWRVFGTGLSFVAVGIGGVFVFPVLNIVIRSRQQRTVIARHLIRFTFRCIVGLMRVMGVFRYEISGLERLERHGLLILANHPTLIDIVFLMAFVKRADCIVKSRLWRNPFTHATVRAAAYVRNDDYGVQLIEDCVAAVRPWRQSDHFS